MSNEPLSAALQVIDVLEKLDVWGVFSECKGIILTATLCRSPVRGFRFLGEKKDFHAEKLIFLGVKF